VEHTSIRKIAQGKNCDLAKRQDWFRDGPRAPTS
jgi:hypothetical protein